MEVFLIAAWCIWKEHNAQIFEGRQPSLATWKVSFAGEIILHLHRVKPELHEAVKIWLSSVV
jgi:hypothetical protein